MIRAPSKEAAMGGRARVGRTKQKLEAVLGGLESGNVSETRRRCGIAPNLYYRWEDEALQGATAALGAEERRGGRGVNKVRIAGWAGILRVPARTSSQCTAIS
jgi:transposase-like protein